MINRLYKAFWANGKFIIPSRTSLTSYPCILQSSSINSLLPGDQIRERIQLYRKLMSPKQWKQFLSQTLPGQGSMQFNLALLEASVIGVRRAVAECRYQFRNERWNCSQVPNTDTVLFGNLLLKGQLSWSSYSDRWTFICFVNMTFYPLNVNFGNWRSWKFREDCWIGYDFLHILLTPTGGQGTTSWLATSCTT